MRVDGQRHAPAAGKETRYPLYRRPVWTGAEYLALTGIRSPDRPARSESLYRLQCRLRRVLQFAWWCRPDQQTLRAWTDCVRCMFKCLGVSLHAPITSINQSIKMHVAHRLHPIRGKRRKAARAPGCHFFPQAGGGISCTNSQVRTKYTAQRTARAERAVLTVIASATDTVDCLQS